GALCQRIRDSMDLLKFPNGSSSSGDGSSSRGSSPVDDLITMTSEFAGGAAAAASLPEYQNGLRYAPGQYCKNDHYMLDKACAILGAIAAGMWLIDFCLIFGFCGSSGQYGPYRRNEHLGSRSGGHRQSSGGGGGGMGNHHQRRGQVGAEEYMIEEDYYPAGGHPPPMRHQLSGHDGEGATIYSEQDRYYYDLLEQRKRELEWRENRTLDDPKGHVQGPIPLSMQQSYYPTIYPNNVVVVREAITTGGVVSPPVRMVVRDDFATFGGLHGMTALSPPPRPFSSSITAAPATAAAAGARLVQLPDSPTLPGQEKAQQQQQEKQDQEGQPQPLQFPIPAEPSIPQPAAIAPIPTAPQSPLSTPRTPRQKTPKQTLSTSRLQQQNILPTLELPPRQQFLNVTTPEESTSATSPRYVIYPPGPACYVFDASQQEYLPSFVNMAARIEQKQNLKHSFSLSSSSHGSIATAPAAMEAVTSPGSPRHSVPSTPTASRSHRVMVTELGMEVITRSSSEIEAERLCAVTGAALESTDSLSTFDCTSASGTPTCSGLALTPTAVGGDGGSRSPSRPQRIAMPSDGSYFPPQPGVGSPTGSLKSFTSRKSSNSHHSGHHCQNHHPHSPHHYLQHMDSHPHPHSPLGTEISHQADGADEDDDENEDVSQLPPQPQQQHMPLTKKPSMLKCKTSKLTTITPTQLQSPSSIHQPASAGSVDPHSLHVGYTPSPPRSPYVGDF
ncbi:hypothetical protein BGW39_009975, partial [Mortierella sp. 14UC]